MDLSSLKVGDPVRVFESFRAGMADQADLVRIVHELRQVFNYKG